MGLTVPTTSDATPAIVGGAIAAPATGVRGWYHTLSPRDRAIYAIMIAMLAIIVAIYMLVGIQTLLNRTDGPAIGGEVTSAPTAVQPAGAAATPSAAPTDIPATPTDLPTNTPAPSPTVEPTEAPMIIPPTSRPTQPPTAAPSATSAPTAAPARPTSPPATNRPPAPRAPSPTRAPRPTSPPTQAPPPTEPPATASIQPVTLYFDDSTGTVMVPVRRNTRVADKRVAAAAIGELIAGPRNGLLRLVSAEANLLGITIDSGTATVNFDRDPSDSGERGIDSIVFTLTELPTISRVQIQVNGANLGGVRARPVLNPLNPQNLAVDYSSTEFLPIYFPSADGVHDVRLIRMVPKTKQTAEGTVRALLEGPGTYAGVVRRVIPDGTELRGIRLSNGVLQVDFTEPFAGAPDAAIRTIVESLTTLKTISGVQFLVEGQVYLDGKIFERPGVNQE